MTIPLWTLLAFALWTLGVLGFGIGVHRWSQILRGKANFATFAEFRIEGPAWYCRAMRTHQNCVENLPIYGALVLVATLAHVHSSVVDVAAIVFMLARVLHTTVHVAFEQTNRVVAARSTLFNLQVVCMTTMGVVTAWHAA
jgi:uncharacterized MAPEG superfamily protein